MGFLTVPSPTSTSSKNSVLLVRFTAHRVQSADFDGILMVADSKTLTAESREALLEVMMEHGDDVKWAVRVMSPHDLSRGMLRRNPYNL